MTGVQTCALPIYGERDAEVGDGELDDWAAQALDDGQYSVIFAADERGGALGEVDAESGYPAKKLQDCLHGLDVVRLRVTEEDHIIRIKRDGGDRSGGVQPAYDPELGDMLEQATKGVYSQDEQLRRHGVPLAQALAVPNWGAGASIEQHLGASRRQEDRQPLKESIPEAVLLQHLEEERPGYRVECPREIKLQHYARCSQLVQKASRLAHQDEVVVEAASRDEGVLVVADEGVESRREAERQHLGEDFWNQVDEADRPIVP